MKGVKHGYGKIVYASGNIYEGHWEKDLKEGKGTMSWETLMERVCFLYKYIKQAVNNKSMKVIGHEICKMDLVFIFGLNQEGKESFSGIDMKGSGWMENETV